MNDFLFSFGKTVRGKTLVLVFLLMPGLQYTFTKLTFGKFHQLFCKEIVFLCFANKEAILTEVLFQEASFAR